jgi:uncharacterized protein (TIGR03663 family)
METRRSSRVWALLLAAGVVTVALALRLPRLGQRPMHGDEANQAVRTGQLLETGVYHYDPNDHHGPALYYAALPFCRATSASFAETTEWNYRLVPVAFSCLTLLLMLGLGITCGGGIFPNRNGLVAAVFLTAVSPAMVYYSRFFIQESMFVTFLTGMLVCAVGYVRAMGGAGVGSRERSPSWSCKVSSDAGVEGEGPHAPRRVVWYALGFGAFAGLAMATKETVVLSFAAAAVAAVAACGFRRLLRSWNTRHVLVAAAAAAVVAVLLYSSFFTYPRGVYDALFATVSAYLKRATAVPEHQHPWNYYLQILFWFKYGRGPVWSEAGLVLPALAAVVAVFWPRKTVSSQMRWVRFLAVYTLVLTALYSAIPYKTPWCALTFLHGFILLAGVGFGEVFAWLEKSKVKGVGLGRGFAYGLLLALVLRESKQTERACFQLPADPRNPYVYAHTGTDAMNLVAEVRAAAQRASGYDTLIAIAAPASDTWPLPWYLRKYRQVGYWTRVADIPAAVNPAVVIAASDQGDAAEERFGQGKRAAFFGIRPGVLLNVFVPVQEAGGKRE